MVGLIDEVAIMFVVYRTFLKTAGEPVTYGFDGLILELFVFFQYGTDLSKENLQLTGFDR